VEAKTENGSRRSSGEIDWQEDNLPS
jgi:hypothetical protein